jgi:pimeloyl-ACP methyl ester carboxylesterase
LPLRQIYSPAPPARISRISSSDGTQIAAYEWGDEGRPPIVLIHGVYQSALSWHRQFSNADLAARYRIIAIDIRGHGASDKPYGEAFYRDGGRFADDIHALIEQLQLIQPVLVGWSFGGRVINDYLTVHGDARLGGLVYVGARSVPTMPDEPPPSRRFTETSRMARSDDPATFIRGTQQFVRLCFHRIPLKPELDMLAMNSMQTPLYVRNQIMGRRVDYGAVLQAIRVPTLIVHGRQDAIIGFRGAELSAAAIGHSQLIGYDDVGHAPFAEDTARFNQDLDGFIEGLFAKA